MSIVHPDVVEQEIASEEFVGFEAKTVFAKSADFGKRVGSNRADDINTRALIKKASPSEAFVRNNYFPTMVYQYDVVNCAEINKRLLELTYAERESGVAVNKSNTAELGSWHSATMLHKNPAYQPILTEIDAALGRISDELNYATDQVLKITTMWSIINPPGNGNRAHVHPNSLWSGVYYVQAPENAGKIEFIDPRTVLIMNQPKYETKKKRPRDCWTKVNFKPVPGRMIIFPAWLYHGVDINTSKEKGRAADRIIISFNINQVKR
ncbi:TIGR02466 family protein [Sphingomonas sp. M1-B02]|uniref:TIGR02466 family protein n=1 Tax=Sphingomonas sp. M1-B02 TaxID=3114300 RepID=UPI00223E9A12|nr:TIGR02466 family protein [Sphingomonas sp. S6-11]UZK67715.1 TIGR02466 family protein [Sphingomonas sp. S6-11]